MDMMDVCLLACAYISTMLVATSSQPLIFFATCGTELEHDILAVGDGSVLPLKTRAITALYEA